MRVAGLGCQRGVAVAEVLEALAASTAEPLDALATVPAKGGEPALAEAARVLGLPLMLGATAADDARLLSRSVWSVAATGMPSACEAAALAVAGPDARLLGPRRVHGRVTCAIAVSGRMP